MLIIKVARILSVLRSPPSALNIDIRYHYTRELAADRIIDIRLCPSKENAADGLTKLLRSDVFTAFLRNIGLD
ncbi:hypothetical protein BDV29DRAFT_40362 [Aspergillus leporis]|uniref:Uncharacterized protein n=1 Tax=Aspergillus leporis TaxID=41062 RepID=A0A5N5WP17_9EURO|nr:hypothetical protein BDV29DRAFT_40362 [Aspergillus leporis]